MPLFIVGLKYHVFNCNNMTKLLSIKNSSPETFNYKFYRKKSKNNIVISVLVVVFLVITYYIILTWAT